ncbi:hypothetical protein AAFF27_06690 [Xylophilus sp. GW821-FHT01B05]
MSKIAALSFCLLAGALSSAHATCYTVYGRGDGIVYQSSRSPVDMRYPLHQTVPARFGPGASMVFSLSLDACPAIGADDGTTGPTTGYLSEVANRQMVNADALGVPRPRSEGMRPVTAPPRRGP